MMCCQTCVCKPIHIVVAQMQHFIERLVPFNRLERSSTQALSVCGAVWRELKPRQGREQSRKGRKTIRSAEIFPNKSIPIAFTRLKLPLLKYSITRKLVTKSCINMLLISFILVHLAIPNVRTISTSRQLFNCSFVCTKWKVVIRVVLAENTALQAHGLNSSPKELS